MFWQVLFVFLTALIAADAELPACGETSSINKVRAYRIIEKNHFNEMVSNKTENFCRCETSTSSRRRRVNYESDNSWNDPALTVTTHRYVNASWGAKVTHKHMFCKFNAVVRVLCNNQQASTFNDTLILLYSTPCESKIHSVAPINVTARCGCVHFMLYKTMRTGLARYQETFVCSERLERVNRGEECAHAVRNPDFSYEWVTTYTAKCHKGHYYCVISEEADANGRRVGRCVAVAATGL